jgi:hypothetical protein
LARREWHFAGEDGLNTTRCQRMVPSPSCDGTPLVLNAETPASGALRRRRLYSSSCAALYECARRGVNGVRGCRRPSPVHAKHAGPKTPKSSFFGKILLLAHPTQLAESFPMGPCSTSGDKNSLRYDLGPHHCDCHVST